MKKSIVFLAAATILIVSVLAFMAFRNSDSGSKKKPRYSITGTWQLDAYKYSMSPSSFTKITSDRPHIKLITENRFLWVTYDTGTKEILESAGGTYTLDGENYTESVDYGYKMDNILGSRSNFKIKVEDGMFYLTGEISLSNGYHIEEIWQKVK
jgi:hypothetical protein